MPCVALMCRKRGLIVTESSYEQRQIDRVIRSTSPSTSGRALERWEAQGPMYGLRIDSDYGATKRMLITADQLRRIREILAD